jgi:hypothetical protein
MHSFSFDALRKRLFRLNGNLLRKLRQPRQGGINPDYATLGDYYIECGVTGKVLERHIDLERLGRKLTKKQ